MTVDDRSPKRDLYTVLVLVIIAFSTRFSLSLEAVHLTPDAVEYLDQARSDARGDLGTLTIKRHYLDDYPVVYSGTGYRPPMFPLLGGAVLALNGSVYAVQLVNALVASIAVGIWFLAFVPLFSWRVAAGGALAASFSGWFWGCSVISLTEPLSMLVCGAIVWIVTSGRWRSWPGAAGIGFLYALAYMTRHMNVILVPLLLGLWAIGTWRLQGARARLRSAGGLLLAALVGAATLGPLAVKNMRDFGRPFYDPNSMVFRGASDTWDHFSAPLAGSVLEFVARAGPRALLAGALKGFLVNLVAITVGHGGLGPMILAAPLLILELVRRRQSEGILFLAILSVVNYAAYSPLYGFDYTDPRFILLTVFPMFPLCLHAVDSWPWLNARRISIAGRKMGMTGAVVWLLVAVSLMYSTCRFVELVRNYPVSTIRGTPVRTVPRELLCYTPANYERLFDEIESLAGPNDIVATGMPWIVNFFTLRPTANLPVDLDRRTFPAFLDRYGVRVVVLEPVSLGEERFDLYEGILRSLAEEGEGEVTRNGEFVFYRIE